MNIETVAYNLRFRIDSKEKLLASYIATRDSFPKENVPGKTELDLYFRTVITETKVNIEGLYSILQDVEQCIGVEE